MKSVPKTNASLSKVDFKTIKVDNREIRIFEPIKLKTELENDVFMKMEHDGYEDFNIILREENSSNSILGINKICIFPRLESIWESQINVLEKFRSPKDKEKNKSHRFGEILTIGTIISALENNKKRIDLFSVPDAVLFHTKYGYVPKIGCAYDEVFAVMTQISNEKNDIFQNCTKKAKLILKEMVKQKTKICIDEELSKKADVIINEYIQIIRRENLSPKEYEFPKGIGMTLSDQKIKSQKEFFENLFKKHGIDYKI